jgi:hypothetical protein
MLLPRILKGCQSNCLTSDKVFHVPVRLGLFLGGKVVVEVYFFCLAVYIWSILLLLAGLPFLELLIGHHCGAVVVWVSSPALIHVGVLYLDFLNHFFNL